jgi:glycosyltransferase involved in cell wall biosynthesis
MWTAVEPATHVDGVQSLRLKGERWGLPLDWLFYHTDWRHLGSRRNLAAITPEQFDIVHLHNIHGEWLSYKAAALLCRRMPVVWTLHDEWAPTAGLACDLSRIMPLPEAAALTAKSIRNLPYHATPRVQRLRRFLDRWMPQPATIICPSAHMLELTQQSGRFPQSRLVHIPNGLKFLDSPHRLMPRDEARRRTKAPTDAAVLLLIASQLAVLHKGFDLAVDIINRIAARTKLHVALLGHDASSLTAQLRNVTTSTGYASNDEQLAAAYRAADVTLIPSRADNFPFVALESLACRTPIAAFRIGGLREMIGDDERGVLADNFNTDQLAGKIAALLNDPPRREALEQAGEQWVAEHCVWSDHLKRINWEYLQTLERWRSATPRGR